MYFWIIKIRLFDKHTIEQTTDVRIFNPATSNINRAVWSLFKSEEKKYTHVYGPFYCLFNCMNNLFTVLKQTITARSRKNETDPSVWPSSRDLDSTQELRALNLTQIQALVVGDKWGEDSYLLKLTVISQKTCN